MSSGSSRRRSRSLWRSLPGAVLVTVATAALVASPALAMKVQTFRSPSRATTCQMVSGDQGVAPFAGCYNDYTLGVKSTDQQCGAGSSVAAVQGNQPARFTEICNPFDFPGQEARSLAYGHSVRVGALRCTSRKSGMTCRSLRSGHGLTLSRSSARFF